jgi:hypothetical protein
MLFGEHGHVLVAVLQNTVSLTIDEANLLPPLQWNILPPFWKNINYSVLKQHFQSWWIRSKKLKNRRNHAKFQHFLDITLSTVEHFGPVWIMATGYHAKILALTSSIGNRLDWIPLFGAMPKIWLASSDLHGQRWRNGGGRIPHQNFG